MLRIEYHLCITWIEPTITLTGISYRYLHELFCCSIIVFSLVMRDPQSRVSKLRALVTDGRYFSKHDANSLYSSSLSPVYPKSDLFTITHKLPLIISFRMDLQ